MAPEAAIGDQIDIAAEEHHRDAVVFVFLDDVVTDFFLVIATLCCRINVLQGNHSYADATTIIKRHILGKAFHIVFGRDEQYLITRHGTVAARIAIEHLGILRQAADTVSRLGT